MFITPCRPQSAHQNLVRNKQQAKSTGRCVPPPGKISVDRPSRQIHCDRFFLRPLFSKKGRGAGASRAGANLCLGDYLWAAPSFLVPKLSTASAFSPSANDVSAVFFFSAAALLEKRPGRGRVKSRREFVPRTNTLKQFVPFSA